MEFLNRKLIYFLKFQVGIVLEMSFICIKYFDVEIIINVSIICRIEEEINERIKEFQGYLDIFVQELFLGELEFFFFLNLYDRMFVYEVQYIIFIYQKIFYEIYFKVIFLVVKYYQ